MRFMPMRRCLKLCVVCALLPGLPGAPIAMSTEAATPDWTRSVQAQYRGCQSEGWCWFQTQELHAQQSLLRVRPARIAPLPGDHPVAHAVRDRLNTLLASMIHQHKRIALHGLRALADGTFEAEITVNEASVGEDPLLLELVTQ